MDHELIDESQVADRYLMGKLDDEEGRRFEEHFLDCPQCLERLETVDGLRTALKGLRPEELPSPAPASLENRALSRWRLLLPYAAAAVLFLAISSSLLFYRELVRTRGALESARLASRSAQLRQADLEQTLLRREEALRVRTPDSLTALGAVPVAASVFTLNLTRGAASAAPENRVILPESPGWITLVFDRPDQPGFASYRARLSTLDGRPLGETMPATANSGMLAVSLPSSLVKKSDYLLTVQGSGSDRVETLATYRFRAVAGKNQASSSRVAPD